MNNNTYSRCTVTVSTVKKSHASMDAACSRRNARQLSRSRSGAGGTPARIRVGGYHISRTPMCLVRSTAALTCGLYGAYYGAIRCAAVDDEFGAGHERRFVGCQKEDHRCD